MDVTAIVKAVATPIINGLFSVLKNYSEKDQSESDIEINIETHVKEILNWSEKIQFFEMHKPNLTDDASIELSFGIPRKFRAEGVNETVSEDYLLELNDNLLILGDPGAGKTTTLKRIARKLLINEPLHENDQYQYPILIKLRDIEQSNTSPDNIYREDEDGNRITKHRIDLVSNKLAEIFGLKISEKISEKEELNGNKKIKIINVKYYIGDDLVDIAISKILNNTKTIVMIDGLDELPSSVRGAYENSIVNLASRLRESKIFLTCRTGGYVNRLNGFTLYEICPLTKIQIDNVIIMWANNPQAFMNALTTVPYSDMTNRPLFLNQLIITYNYYDDLPRQPCDIYNRIINLMLIKWDKDRKVIRESKYSDFHPDKKIKFLSAIAYELTYKIKSKIFDIKELVIAYHRVCDRFSLPVGEAEQVAQEIESHTGVIAKTTDNKYEFSHLSLQEYLCAYFVVRDPTLDLIPIYLELYPAPISIAIALSSRPEVMFSNIFLDDALLSNIPKESIKIMLSRLLMESPGFSANEKLGLSFFKLMFIANDDHEFADCIDRFFMIPVVLDSIKSVLPYFYVDKHKSTKKIFHIAKKTVPHELYSLTPEEGEISAYLFRKFKSACSFNLVGGWGNLLFQKIN
jgi:DNA polymerase III delta prime subunit